MIIDEENYSAALLLIESLIEQEPESGTNGATLLVSLATAVEEYESKVYPIE